MLIERLLKLALLGSEWVLYLLLVLSVVSFSTMFERWIYFARRGGSAEKLRTDLTKHFEAVDVEGAEKVLAEDRSVQARVARVALRWLPGGPDALADAVDAELGRVRAELEKGLNLLGTLGNNAPFIGLFGTVLGVIIAFHALGDAGGNTNAMGGVMAGIAEALVATGVGLFVALPAVVAYNVIQKKIGDIESEAGSLVKLVSAHAKANPTLIERARALEETRQAEARLEEEDIPSSGSHDVTKLAANGKG
ncbi:MAG TPA: MotA/TolQ/ExbB proton channel family protein [Polyangiaceae bacterium]|nr:MotA/TolQ/ExbB proton channel family protein [Polyangiaceae bacterium]